MSAQKKAAREAFRKAVFVRDNHRCRVCGWKDDPARLDAHHIIDRNDMPNGGYVKENGIALCPACHEKAEQLHSTGTACPGYDRPDLFALIGSDPVKAVAASERLKR